jgi:hypothetical protein
MRKMLSIGVMFVLFGVFVRAVVAAGANAEMAKAQSQRLGEIVVESAKSTASVLAIDYERRIVIVKLADGTSHGLKIGPEAKKFTQIKVGDRVDTTYAKSVAVFTRNSNNPPSTQQTQTVTLAPAGTIAGVVVANTVELPANVEKIDYDRRMVTLKDPDGNLITLNVDSNVTSFNAVKQGDPVVIRRTESTTIAVEAP